MNSKTGCQRPKINYEVNITRFRCLFSLLIFPLFFCMIWFHTIALKPRKHKNHLFIAKTNEWILAPFITIHLSPRHTQLVARLTHQREASASYEVILLVQWSHWRWPVCQCRNIHSPIPPRPRPTPTFKIKTYRCDSDTGLPVVPSASVTSPLHYGLSNGNREFHFFLK